MTQTPNSEGDPQVEYAAFCRSVDLYPDTIDGAKILFHAAGLAGEAGEVANKTKKVFRDFGGVLTDDMRRQLSKELGGVYWYLTRMAEDIGMTVEEIRQINWQQLSARQQTGTLQGSGDDR